MRVRVSVRVGVGVRRLARAAVEDVECHPGHVVEFVRGVDRDEHLTLAVGLEDHLPSN